MQLVTESDSKCKISVGFVGMYARSKFHICMTAIVALIIIHEMILAKYLSRKYR